MLDFFFFFCLFLVTDFLFFLPTFFPLCRIIYLFFLPDFSFVTDFFFACFFFLVQNYYFLAGLFSFLGWP